MHIGARRGLRVGVVLLPSAGRHSFQVRAMKSSCLPVATALLACLLAGCAAEIKRSPTPFTAAPAAQAQERVVMRQRVVLRPEIGYGRILEERSAWKLVGSVPAGKVYRADGFTLTIRSANTHEAYLVINNGQLVGFYLPGEQAFSSINPPVQLPLETQ
jgi:hypothetical protein